MDDENGVAAPQPVPGSPAAAVTDEDRHRFGLLLDKAAERGLLGPADYSERLQRLAEATTTEQMVAIVTDLPAFSVPANATPSAGSARRRGSRSWLVLVVLVAVVVASLLVLTVLVAHDHRSAPSGAPRAGSSLSAPRL